MAKLEFTKKISQKKSGERNTAWRILIVDDDEAVHTVTRLALKDLWFNNRSLEILSAYSAEQACTMLATEEDIAMTLLDVVMETDDAGLRLVRYIREELKKTNMRIVLRTGQPGQAPERQVIVKYDINDYKDKTELTAQKLFSTTITALRTYEHLRAFDSHRCGLQQIIETTDSLDEGQSLKRFAAGVLAQLGTLLGVGDNGVLCVQRMEATENAGEGITIIAASNADWVDQCLDWPTVNIKLEIRELILTTFENKKNCYGLHHTALYIGQGNEPGMVAYVPCPSPEDLARSLLELSCTKIAARFRNVRLYEQLKAAYTELEQKVEERTRELAEANNRLVALASTDALTGIPNRRYFYEMLEREAARTTRTSDAVFSVAMIDIDHFKLVNDKYGHLAGDWVLRKVSERLMAHLRQSDLLGRVGGEEFAVIFISATLADAMISAERLRAAVAVSPINLNPREISVTISLGVVQAESGETIEALMERADNLLYTAKKGGRNCVCSAPLLTYQN